MFKFRDGVSLTVFDSVRQQISHVFTEVVGN